MSEEHEDVAAVTVDPAPVAEKTDEELLAEMEAEEAAKTEAARVAAEESARAESARLEAEAKADEEARVEVDRLEAERLAAEEAVKVAAEGAAPTDSLTVVHPSGSTITMTRDAITITGANVDVQADLPVAPSQSEPQTVVATREAPVHDEEKINLLQLLDGYTDERHAIRVRLYEMLPFFDGAIAKSDGLLKRILMSLSDILR